MTLRVNNNDWIEYKMLVMDKLEHLEKTQMQQNKLLNELHGELVALKTKAGIWGGMAGAGVGAIIATLVRLLMEN